MPFIGSQCGGPMARKCTFCRNLVTVLICGLLGAGSGFLAVLLGGSSETSMLATFLGAILPLMWRVRRDRDVERSDVD